MFTAEAQVRASYPPLSELSNCFTIATTRRDLPMRFVTDLFSDAEKVLQMAVYAAPETIDDEVGEKMEEDFDAMSLFKL